MSFTNLKRGCPVCGGTIVKTEKPHSPLVCRRGKLQGFLYRRHFHDVKYLMNNFSRVGVTFATSQANETVIKLADDKTIGGLLLNNTSRNELESVPSVGTQSGQQPEQPQQLSLFEGGDDAL